MALKNLRRGERSQVLVGDILVRKGHTARRQQQQRPWRDDEAEGGGVSNAHWCARRIKEEMIML